MRLSPATCMPRKHLLIQWKVQVLRGIHWCLSFQGKSSPLSLNGETFNLSLAFFEKITHFVFDLIGLELLLNFNFFCFIKSEQLLTIACNPDLLADWRHQHNQDIHSTDYSGCTPGQGTWPHFKQTKNDSFFFATHKLCTSSHIILFLVTLMSL